MFYSGFFTTFLPELFMVLCMAFYFISSPLKEPKSQDYKHDTHKFSVSYCEKSTQQTSTCKLAKFKSFEYSSAFYHEIPIFNFFCTPFFKEKASISFNSKYDNVSYQRLFYRPPPSF